MKPTAREPFRAPKLTVSYLSEGEMKEQAAKEALAEYLAWEIEPFPEKEEEE